MSIRPLLLALAVFLAALVAGGAVGAPASTVASITDGDTLRLTSGQRVRLLQIDAPERGACYSREASSELMRLAPVGSGVTLESDAQLDSVDRYGRLLRYIRRGGVNVNVELVRRGAAIPYFFDGDRGRYASQLLVAERAAKRARRGQWGAGCATQPTTPLPAGGNGCDRNYAGCIPPYPPDLDCDDIRARGLDPVRVVGSDPHRLDGDGFGCD